MSFRMPSGSRCNPGFVHTDGLPDMTPVIPQAPHSAGPIFAASPSHQAFAYHHHRGHKRGHSYGGPVSPSAAAFYHARLEARPSHPNAHGSLPPIMQISTPSSALLKGHRRALSGCMPMMGGIGVVAWSSLRELQSPVGLRSRSPIELPGDFHPSSPDGKKRPLELMRPVSPEPLTKPIEKESDIDQMECGFGPCLLPESFNGLANIRVFVTILAMLVTLQQSVASGYVNSVITTIELRFEIPSKYMGLVASAHEMGNVITVLFVSYLGAKRHIPRWIAVGVLVMVLGCIIFSLPHFLSSSPNSSSLSNGRGLQSLNSLTTARLASIENLEFFNNSIEFSNDTNVTRELPLTDGEGGITTRGKNYFCHSQNPSPPSKFISSGVAGRGLEDQSESPLSSPQPNEYPTVNRVHLSPTGCEVETNEDGTLRPIEPESYAHPLILFTIAQILLGVGGSPLFTLGITYVDDHVPKSSSSIYIGIVYAMGAFGPVLGFLGGAWLLTIPASLTSVAVPDSEFIGMWWGGFLIVGILLFVACLPFLTFPRFLQKNKDDDFDLTQIGAEIVPAEQVSCQEVTPDSHIYGQSIKDIPRSMFRLFRNPTYVITCLAGCMEMNIISGFVVFLPKYLETQFGLGKSEASVFTGGIAIPGAFFGILAGGYFMKRMELTPSGAAKFVVITSCICLLGQATFFFLGCTNPKLAGATIPYPDSLNPLEYMPYSVNLTSFCNMGCSCDSSADAQYVCHGGITYFSPCHAGCSGNLSQCACAGGGEVIPGVCPDSPCKTLLPFMIILFLMTATVAMMQMPSLMIVLRSVSEEERSFALGMQFVLFRLLGYIPSPIIFGNVIDSSCLLWSIRRCSSLLPAVSGRCLRYDIMDFRYKYVGMLTGFKLMAMSLFLYNYFQLRRMERNGEEKDEELRRAESENFKIRSNSVYSLDKLFEDGSSGEEEGGEVKVTVVGDSVLSKSDVKV